MILLDNIFSFIKRPCDFIIAFYVFALLKIQILNFLIGHNVSVGRSCVIVSQVGISGSTTVGDQVQIGGQAGLAGHLKIGRGARIGGQAGVMNDVPAGADVIGSPAQPVREFFRHIALLRKLARGRSADDAAAREVSRDIKA